MEMQAQIGAFSMASLGDSGHIPVMLSSGELLKRLIDRGIKKADVARVLEIDPSAVTLMFRGKRRILLDEACKLAEHFHLDDDMAIAGLSEPVTRLMVLHAAESLGLEVTPDDPRVQELSSDYRAFAAFAADPKARDNVEQVAGFFRALTLRRSHHEEAHPS